MPICSMDQLYNDRNCPRTKGLFYELSFQSKDEDTTPIFSIRNVPKEGYIPLKKLYLSLSVDDPSEVTFVDEVFGDWPYWLALVDSVMFKPVIEEWRREAEVRRKQKAFQAVIKEMKEGKGSFQAAKYLIEEPWKGGPTAADRKKARSKARETAEEAFHSAAIQSDIERLKEQGILN